MTNFVIVNSITIKCGELMLGIIPARHCSSVSVVVKDHNPLGVTEQRSDSKSKLFMAGA